MKFSFNETSYLLAIKTACKPKTETRVEFVKAKLTLKYFCSSVSLPILEDFWSNDSTEKSFVDIFQARLRTRTASTRKELDKEKINFGTEMSRADQ